MTHSQFTLPRRTGAEPAVTDGIPHIQLDQTASDEILEKMTLWALASGHGL